MPQLQVEKEEQAEEYGGGVIKTIEDIDAVIVFTKDQDLTVEEMKLMLEIYDLAKDGLKYRGEK
jgi:hypothetical protein